MDVIWSKDKLFKIFSTESIMVHANATGDSGSVSGPCCHICGGDSDLRRLEETYVWNGIEEQYDRMLFECYGVRVPKSDCMICDHCIHQLRNAQRFRRLVQAAFTKPPEESPLRDGSKIKIVKSLSSTKIGIAVHYTKKNSVKEIKPKVAIDNLQKKCELRRERKRLFNTHVETKKANVACTICNHRYPMIVPFDGIKKFVCSRCKKNSETYGICRKCNLRMPMNSMNEHLKSHAKIKPKGKNRLSNFTKPPVLNKTVNLSRTQTFVKYPKKYQCSQCEKKYIVPQHLAQHIAIVHGDSLNCTCTVCGKDMKTREMLGKHMSTHTGQPIYKCNICMKIFKSQRNLQAHYLTHEKY
ncbi:unnamed protein product [Parnassius mnemosyne]|uniref:C2H2-type domain-containing protein n=1 Tax=Parnassius mnemosyne TaxID=213953 RepID=A0AAV1KXQ1_9NEOP